jgi:predicted NACHT family NTPase
MQRQILRCVTSASHTFLGSYLRLETDWINYLLAENPDSAWLAARCQRKSVVPPAQSTTALPVRWEQLILSSTLKTQLQTLTQQVAAGAHPAVLLVGARGTGKTTAARALATALQQPLTLIDLANQPGVPGSRPESPLLLIKSAQHWFGRSAELSSAQLSQWLQQRRQQPGLTILTLRYRHLIPAAWRQRFDVVLDLPSPTATQRQQLWQQALSLTSQGEDDSRDAWQRQLRMLAQKLPLTGGQINAIAQTAIDLAQTAGTAVVQLPQLQQALVQHGQTVHLKDSLN